MSVQKGWKVNVNRCIGCRSCELACKTQFRLDAGEGRRRKVIDKTISGLPSGVGFPGGHGTFYISLACNQCAHPACLRACPVGAYAKDSGEAAKDILRGIIHQGGDGLWYRTKAADKVKGVVLHDPDKCIGCRRCEWACPYAAPQYNPTTKKVHKCELCHDRISNDNLSPERRVPACVAQCLGSLSQRKDPSLPNPGPVDLVEGPTLEMVDVDPDLASETYTGETTVHGDYWRPKDPGAGGATGSGRGSDYLADYSLTKPALKIKNRVYTNRGGGVV